MKEEAEYYKLMLELAGHDFIAMSKLQTDDVPEDVFGFHCQQAIEKTFKALIDFYGKKFPLTHELEDLYDILLEINSDIAKFDELVFFTPYSVLIRYGEVGFDEPLNRQKAIADVKNLIDFAQATTL